MSVKIGILQPGYLPWLGFFEQLHRADAFVLLDDVQYDKHGWRNRNRIKTAAGAQWLTVPVKNERGERTLVRDVSIDNRHDWRKKHHSSIRQNYRKAPYFDRYRRLFEEGYSREWDLLVDLDVFFIEGLCSFLGLDTGKVVRSSALAAGGGRQERLVAICRELGADTFYEGASGRSYIDEDFFRENGIRVEFQDYRHPVYRQLYGDFVPFLSVVDLLFNHGDESLAVLSGGSREEAGS